MNPFQFDISLRVFHPSLLPAEIWRHLELEADLENGVGQPRSTPKGQPLEGSYRLTYCLFNLSRVGEEALHETIERIAVQLKPKEEFLRRLRSSGGRAELFIGWYSPSNSGDILSHELLKNLGNLGIDLALDVYSGAAEATATGRAE